MLHYPQGFARGVANYRVTFTHGYAPGDIPLDIKEVAREMVAKCYLDYLGQGGKGYFGKSGTSQSTAAGSLNTTLKDLNPEWTRILSAYAVRNVMAPSIGFIPNGA